VSRTLGTLGRTLGRTLGSTLGSTLGTLGNVALGATPWVPWERRFGLDSLDAATLTRMVAGEVAGAHVLGFTAQRDRQTTDRARLLLEWNDAGRSAGLPTALFAKGTPSLASSRILNSAFGLCGTEVRFYTSAHADLADLLPGATLTPYHASLGRGGRFLLVLESRDVADTHFFQMRETATPEHARDIVTTLATMHARFHESPRFATDLAWVTRYSGRPGQAIAPRILTAAERGFRKRYDVPDEVRQIIGLHVRHAAELTAIWEALPSTLCHGDTHLGNTFRTTAGHSGLFDWQEVHRMNGLREIAYFIASAFDPAERRVHERDLIALYLGTLAAAGQHDVPSATEAFDLYRLLMLDAWRSVWASLALMPVQQDDLADVLIGRHVGHLLDLDVLGATQDALGRARSRAS